MTLKKLEFSDQIFVKLSNIKFNEICTVGAKLFHAAWRTDRQRDITRLSAQERYFQLKNWEWLEINYHFWLIDMYKLPNSWCLGTWCYMNLYKFTTFHTFQNTFSKISCSVYWEKPFRSTLLFITQHLSDRYLWRKVASDVHDTLS